jgi:hypothetical protein
MQQLKTSINCLVTSHPVSKSLRVVMQVVTSGKPLSSIAREFDAVYEYGMHMTKPKSSICLLVTSKTVSKSLRVTMQVVILGKPLRGIHL